MTRLRAGAAKRSIAPNAEHLAQGVWLGGFGSYRQRRATSVLDAPECRVIALADGDSGLVISALDLIGARGPLLASIRDRAAAATGLSPEHILVACTHSHASPDTQGLWGGVPADYERHVVDEAVGAIAEALASMKSAELRAASVVFDGLVRNRRDWPITDTTLSVLRLLTPDGAPIATLANYACHPTAIGSENAEISRDWCGYAVDIIEQAAGGIAVYVNGAIGDVNPLFSGGVNHAKTLGQSLAAWVLEALQAAKPVGSGIEIRTAALELPLAIDRLESGISYAITESGIEVADGADVGESLHAGGRGDLAQMHAAVRGMRERALVTRGEKTFLQTMCTYARVGDVEIISAPGEMMTRLALPLRASLAAPHRLIFGLTHDTLGYFIPQDEFMTGRNNNYEESVSMGFPAGALLNEKLLSLID